MQIQSRKSFRTHFPVLSQFTSLSAVLLLLPLKFFGKVKDQSTALEFPIVRSRRHLSLSL